MKKILLIAILVGASTAQAKTSIRSHTRINRSYVAPHIQNSPAGTTLDNYSTQGNYNPYSGAKKHRTPTYGGGYSVPSFQSQPMEPIQRMEPIQPYGIHYK